MKNVEMMSKTIADLVDDHVLVCDADGRIVFSNRAVQSYLGYMESELEQKRVSDLIAEADRDKLQALLDNASEAPSDRDELLWNGKHGVRKLHMKCARQDGLSYLFGNEIYAEYERIQKKLNIEIANAMKIYRRSLPERLPKAENLSFASLYLPAEEIGGDIFDIFKVDNGLLSDYFEQYVCFVADVSGHGLDSAMLAVFVKDTIRSFFRLKHMPGQVLSPKEIMHFLIEQYVKEGYPEEYLVCLFIAVFDLKTNELTYCNAGLHTCPLLSDSEGEVTELSRVGMPVSTGLDVDWLKYTDTSFRLFPGMTLFMMSDGLPEQRTNAVFYEERLRKLIAELYSMEPDAIVRRIHADVTDFLKNGKARDDITLVVAKLAQPKPGRMDLNL